MARAFTGRQTLAVRVDASREDEVRAGVGGPGDAGNGRRPGERRGRRKARAIVETTVADWDGMMAVHRRGADESRDSCGQTLGSSSGEVMS